MLNEQREQSQLTALETEMAKYLEELGYSACAGGANE